MLSVFADCKERGDIRMTQQLDLDVTITFTHNMYYQTELLECSIMHFFKLSYAGNIERIVL